MVEDLLFKPPQHILHTSDIKLRLLHKFITDLLYKELL